MDSNVMQELMLSADGRYVQWVGNTSNFETPDADGAWRVADGTPLGTGTALAALPARANRVVTHDSRAHRLAVWDFDRNELIARLPRQRSRDEQGNTVPLKAAISDDGRRIASASPDGLVRVWAIDARRLLGEARVGAAVTALAFDAPGRQLAVGRVDGQVWVLNISAP
jgi:WD40 repeat protein